MPEVFFSTMRVQKSDSIPAKLQRLVRAAGLEELDLFGKYVAIKTHFGELNNISHLKPAYTRAIAQAVKEHGGKPFVTDCSTLYPGMRSNLLDHMECARLNGFTQDSCGCEVVIGDGLRGNDEVIISIPDGAYVQEARIGRAIVDADVLISLTHAKGCAATAFAGTLKNVGMGCGSRGGKMIMHSNGIPKVIDSKCTGCLQCLKSCANDAIVVLDNKASINNNCVGCGYCLGYCPRGAIVSISNKKFEYMNMKIAEYTAAVVRGKQCLHVAIAVDITPNCDCFAGNDAPVVPNVGMFASLDPLAIDAAVSDAIVAQPVIEGSALAEMHETVDEGCDHFHAINPESDWVAALEHAEKMGIGSREYKLVVVD